MSSITIRNLDPAIKERLRIRAASTVTLWRPRPGASCRARSKSRPGYRRAIFMSASAPASSLLVARTISSCRRVCRIAIRLGSIDARFD